MVSSLLFAQEDVPVDPWADAFLGLDSDMRFVVLLVAIGCATALLIVLTSIIAGVVHSIKEKNIEADLKRDMLDRGMSSEEIEQVIGAKPKDGVQRWVETWTGKKHK